LVSSSERLAVLFFVFFPGISPESCKQIGSISRESNAEECEEGEDSMKYCLSVVFRIPKDGIQNSLADKRISSTHSGALGVNFLLIRRLESSTSVTIRRKRVADRL